jgi:hypothetical protein
MKHTSFVIKPLTTLFVIGMAPLMLSEHSFAESQTPATYEECVQAQDSFKQRRRAGRQAEARLNTLECEKKELPRAAEPTPAPDAPIAERGESAKHRRELQGNMPAVTVRGVPPPAPVPDRWRIVEALGYKENLWDPFHQNTLKGDKPILQNGADLWFFAFTGISDTVIESRYVPTPVGVQSSNDAGDLDVFGSGEQYVYNQNLATEFVWYKGNTVFMPPAIEFRLTPVFNWNTVEIDEVTGLYTDPAKGVERDDSHVGIQAAFVDYHLRDVSSRYDFDSIRVGIQPMTADFRGFLFNDNQLGVRVFGIRDNNIYQYNIGWFRRVEKDTNSGLNDLGQPLRDDDVFIANLFKQDFVFLGLTSEWIVVHNRNREDGEYYYDRNRFLTRPAAIGTERPRQYDVTYLGYAAEGHVKTLNVSLTTYYAFGEERPSVFTDQDSEIAAGMTALELSRDYDWIRPRLSLMHASADKDPFDDRSTGFDAIFENPLFAGADTSYWIRQGVPLIGGGRVALSSRNGLLNSMRSSKEEGQSNFVNPGLNLVGLGVDFDILPEVRLSFNANHLAFADTSVVEVARNQGGVDKDIGWDVSTAAIYRPLFNQNIVMRLSYAMLLPGSGYEQLFEDERPYSLLANLILTY